MYFVNGIGVIAMLVPLPDYPAEAGYSAQVNVAVHHSGGFEYLPGHVRLVYRGCAGVR